MQGTYIGPLGHLKGKTAMLRKMPEEGYVVAQFDDRTLTRSGEPVRTEFDNPPSDALGYGWHAFRASEFDIGT